MPSQLESPDARLAYIYLMDSILKNSHKHYAEVGKHYVEMFRAHAGKLVVDTYFLPSCKDDIKCALHF